MSRFFPVIAGAALLLCGLATAEPNALPYDEFAKFTEKLPGEKVDGQLVIGAYLKSREPGAALDPTKANFRILMPDGKVIPLKWEALPRRPEEAKNPVDGKRIQAGFTHKLWIPKDPAVYAGAALLNDLLPESLEVQFPLPAKEE